MENLIVPGPTPCPEAVLQVQSKHKTLSQMKNDLLVLTGAGTMGWQQP
jgi:aspartate aminotransferase-like enzyme